MTLCPLNSDEATSQGPQPLISYLWVASPLSLQSLSTAEWGARTHPPNSQTSPDMGLRGKERIAQCLGLSEKTTSILLVSCHMLLSLPSAKSKPRSSTSERPRAAPVCTWSRERTATPTCPGLHLVPCGRLTHLLFSSHESLAKPLSRDFSTALAILWEFGNPAFPLYPKIVLNSFSDWTYIDLSLL